MVAGKPAFDVCELRAAFQSSRQLIGCQGDGRRGIDVDDPVPELLVLETGEDRPGVPAECLGNDGVISPPTSPAEHFLRQLPTPDLGDDIDIARDHHHASGDRYLLTGHAVRQPFPVPVLKLITKRPNQGGSKAELNRKHSCDLARRTGNRLRLLWPRGQHPGDDSRPLGDGQAGAHVPHYVRD